MPRLFCFVPIGAVFQVDIFGFGGHLKIGRFGFSPRRLNSKNWRVARFFGVERLAFGVWRDGVFAV
jgi:hypothetical protein